MKNTLKNALVIFGYKFLFTLLALVFLYSFANLLSGQTGQRIYSAVISLMYLAAVYSYIWKTGKADSKKGFNLNNAILPVLIAEIPTYIITIVKMAVQNEIVTVIYRIYQFIYVGFLTDWASQILILTPVFVAAILGYILGFKKFEIYDRIIMRIVYKVKSK